MNRMPTISVVMPSFNQGKYLEQAITSVLGQCYPNLELLVIDGGSTDETPEILQQYADRLTYTLSEPDHGQAEAINKGFRAATGDILAWLNSDDMYLPGALSKIARKIGQSSEPMLVYGGCLFITEGTPCAYGTFPPEFDAERLTYDDYIVQPSAFWTRSLWEAVGELNESYTYVLDWDWFLRAAKIATFIPLREMLSIYRQHDQHKTGTGGFKRRQEMLNIVETYASEKWAAAYRDVFARIPAMKLFLNRLVKWRLHRLRYLFYPRLFLKHGRHRVDMAVYAS